MKTLLVIGILVVNTLAAPLQDESQAAIVKSDNENYGTGNYRFR